MIKLIDGSFKALFGSVGVVLGWSLNALGWSGYLSSTIASIAIVFGCGILISSVFYLFLFRRKQQIVDFERARSIEKWLIGLNLNLVNPSKLDIEDLDRIVSYEEFKAWREGKEFIAVA
jgi:hypothetical protein